MPKPKELVVEDKAETFIAPYQEKYEQAIATAREAAETTATHAWQENYRRQMEAHDDAVEHNTKVGSAAFDNMRHYGVNDDSLKAVRDAAKGLAEEQMRHDAWRARNVAPYSDTVESCNAQMLATRRAAKEAQAKAPLHERGLDDGVNRLVDDWPVAKWNDEDGVVTVE